jgi:hypothetical protein
MGRWAQQFRRGGGGLPSTALPAGVTVENVAADDDARGIWDFSDPISVAPANWDALQIEGTSPIGVAAGGGVGDTQVQLTYAAQPVAGDAWAITTSPPGLVFSPGQTLILPQSGLVD